MIRAGARGILGRRPYAFVFVSAFALLVTRISFNFLFIIIALALL